MKVWEVVKGAALAGAAVAATLAASSAFAQQYSVWLVENSRFMGVPYGAFMPDRAFVPGSTSKFNNINRSTSRSTWASSKAWSTASWRSCWPTAAGSSRTITR